jgi:VanZ family protein
LGNRNGLRFGRFSSVVSSGVFQKTSSEGETSATIEVWLQPRLIWNRGTFLAFYTPGNPYQFSLRQFNGGLKLQAEIRNGPRDMRTEILYVKDTFRKSAGVFLTITSGKHGTVVYTDGVLAKTAPQIRFSTKELMARFVVGDSPGQSDSWSGQLRGLAIYGQELTATQVLQHYQTWTQKDRPEISDDEHNLALYLLAERTGRIVHDYAQSGANLYISERYAVMDQIFLEPFWKEFSMSRSYWAAAVKNIVGFLPFGFCFCACLSEHKVRRPDSATVIVGALVSLTIEVLQAYLPTRDSGMTDIFTNTLGTYLGVTAYRALTPVLAGRFPWLPFASPPVRKSG